MGHGQYQDGLWILTILQASLRPSQIVADPAPAVNSLSCFEELIIGPKDMPMHGLGA